MWGTIKKNATSYTGKIKTGNGLATAGLIIGLFFMPWGMIVGPLIGAIIGELIAGSDINKSLKVGLLSFLSFIVTTGIKVVLSVIMTIYIIKAAIAAI